MNDKVILNPSSEEKDYKEMYDVVKEQYEYLYSQYDKLTYAYQDLRMHYEKQIQLTEYLGQQIHEYEKMYKVKRIEQV